MSFAKNYFVATHVFCGLNMLSLGRHDQLTMFHTFNADQLIRNLADSFSLSSDRQNFQTIMMIQMHMHSGNDLLVEFMLHRGQNTAQDPYMMIVNNCHRAHGFCLTVLPFFLYQFIAN